MSAVTIESMQAALLSAGHALGDIAEMSDTDLIREYKALSVTAKPKARKSDKPRITERGKATTKTAAFSDVTVDVAKARSPV